MRLLELTLTTPAENLALDDALLDQAEQAGRPSEVLRIWEPTAPLVVVGRGSDPGREVWLDRARQRRVPVARRSSGGAAIVTGPGCLMYAVVLSYELRPELRQLSAVHQLVLSRLAGALQTRGCPAERSGISDLASGGRKFSGNSLRCRRTHLVYHGTLLYNFPLALVDELLRHPPREPAYRQGRPHRRFVTNLDLPGGAVCEAIRQAWGDPPPLESWPRERTGELVAARYGDCQWWID